MPRNGRFRVGVHTQSVRVEHMDGAQKAAFLERVVARLGDSPTGKRAAPVVPWGSSETGPLVLGSTVNADILVLPCHIRQQLRTIRT
jgi:hypothetical protein